MNGELRKEFEYFISHRDELLKKYDGRVVIIKDQKVVGDYSDELSAIAAVKDKLQPGTFIVQKVDPGKDSYTQTFHSRVSFA